MLAGNINNLKEQGKLNDRMDKAIEFLSRKDLLTLPAGRVEIDGDKVYALIQDYETIPTDNAKFEAHRKYLDIQYVASGKESIGYINLSKLTITDDYNEQKDVIHGAPVQSDITWVVLGVGDLAVLYPTDAHAPKVICGSSSAVRKIVMKVAL